MAFGDFFIGAGGGGPGSTFTAGGNLISPTTDPTFAALLQAAQAAIPTNQPSVMDIAGQGASSPLLEAILGPMLQRLQQPQAAAQRQLTEATRAAGGLRDSAYTTGFNELLQNQGLQRNDLMAQVLQSTLAPLLNATIQQQQLAWNAPKTYADLLGTARPQLVPYASGGGGGGTTMGGTFSSTPYSGIGVKSPYLGADTAPYGRDQYGFMNPAYGPGSGQQGVNYTGSGGGGAGAIDPLTQYLLGDQGLSYPIMQTGNNSWGSYSYSPLTDYASSGMEY